MNRHLLDGWVPLRFYWQAEAPMIDWVYLGAKPFAEPFFDQTIGDCLRHPFNLLFRHQTPIEVLHQRHETHPGVEPTGFIFHMSRSGSTLVTRMLASLPQNIVISEARPLDSTLQAHLRSAQVSEQDRIAWLRWMVSALAQQRLGGETHFFIKFSGWHVLELPLIRKAFPNVPWIFLYRDPIDVLVSEMEQRGQMIPYFLHQSLFGSDAPLVVAMEPEAYSAVILATLCDSALRHRDNGGLLINYTQLPDAVWSSISEFFSVRWTEVEKETMKKVTKVHSKMPAGIFQHDSSRKQEKATAEAREAAQRWLYPIYEKLESQRKQMTRTKERSPVAQSGRK